MNDDLAQGSSRTRRHANRASHCSRRDSKRKLSLPSADSVYAAAAYASWVIIQQSPVWYHNYATVKSPSQMRSKIHSTAVKLPMPVGHAWARFCRASLIATVPTSRTTTVLRMQMRTTNHIKTHATGEAVNTVGKGKSRQKKKAFLLQVFHLCSNFISASKT